MEEGSAEYVLSDDAIDEEADRMVTLQPPGSCACGAARVDVFIGTPMWALSSLVAALAAAAVNVQQRNWNEEQLHTWLSVHGLEEIHPTLRENEIDGDALLYITMGDLVKHARISVGKARLLLVAAKQTREREEQLRHL